LSILLSDLTRAFSTLSAHWSSTTATTAEDPRRQVFIDLDAELLLFVALLEALERVERFVESVDLAGEGVDERWDAMTVEEQGDVIRVLLDVTVLPSTKPRGSRGFDPDAVRLEWRT
jgi:hypothetical protein